MKKILLLLVLVSGLFADYLAIQGGAKSSHLVKGEFNEDHKWLGATLNINDYEIQYANFINSYNKETEFLVTTYRYKVFAYQGVDVGVSGSLGYQKGYCTKGFTTYKCKPTDGDESMLVLYSLWARISDHVLMDYIYIPKAVQAVKFDFIVLDW